MSSIYSVIFLSIFTRFMILFSTKIEYIYTYDLKQLNNYIFYGKITFLFIKILSCLVFLNCKLYPIFIL